MRKSDIIYIFVVATLIILGIAMIGYIVQDIKKEIRYRIWDSVKVETVNNFATDYMKGFLAAHGEQTLMHNKVINQAKQIIEESDNTKAADFRYPMAQRFLMLNKIKRKKVVRCKSYKKEIWVKER
jgi:hypothetical protein